MFINKSGNWTNFRKLPGVREVDFHWADEQPTGSYWENMDQVKATSLDSLRKAQTDGIQYVLFTHGHSTSRIGKQTSRSVVRGVMRSKEATPYIIQRESIQHSSVFVAKIRPLP